jgi:citrate lyase subunit beta/citryl-CoA lyase
VPSHCVVAETRDDEVIMEAATRAAREFGYTRMCSVHPMQIRPIVDGFAPTAAELDDAIEIILAAKAANWAPIRHRDTVHDRASYRHFWRVIERARRTDQPMPGEVEAALFGDG